MNKILSIAQDVRNKCEEFAKSNASKKYDFHNQDDLGCMCAVASFVLARALRRNRIKCNIVSGEFYDNGWPAGNHCWVEVRNKIVDITATQFGDFPPVYVTSKKDEQYKDGSVRNSFLWFYDWNGQKPSPKVIKKILKTS